ncbi:DUF2935 domain-containing protein [Desulfuribacillus alkaliarsenatis]|uniref:Uncharacterized protein n=1 Tax=Desulfuribacillus alkaliarsenatis TaxID=766136 RepID=A0A1E5G036_9FIRM|nr:DUF2935 domain-containing protein [Desulfuribacillus alkaliarsenatis]OEF96205.1 hypothetical protein BHF68_08535 [Desulfuribacillus alkaliarsenatis]
MYSVTTPMLLNSIYEISFWSNIQYEHTIVFTETIDNIPEAQKNKLVAMRKEWKSIHEKAVEIRDKIGEKYQPYPESDWFDAVWKLVLEAEKLNKEFIELLIELGKLYPDNDTIQLLVHHVYEESGYFMRILATIKKLMSV